MGIGRYFGGEPTGVSGTCMLTHPHTLSASLQHGLTYGNYLPSLLSSAVRYSYEPLSTFMLTTLSSDVSRVGLEKSITRVDADR